MKKKLMGLLAVCMMVLMCIPVAAKTDARRVEDSLDEYTVTFRDNNGKNTGKAFSKLDVKAWNTDYKYYAVVELPKVPKVKGYQSLGWTVQKNGKTVQYRPGDKVRVYKNTRFYAVKRRSKYYTVTFLSRDGKATKSYKALNMRVEENTAIKLPQIPGKKTPSYKYLGWSQKKGRKNALYGQGEKIRIKKNTTFYAVYYGAQSSEVEVLN